MISCNSRTTNSMTRNNTSTRESILHSLLRVPQPITAFEKIHRKSTSDIFIELSTEKHQSSITLLLKPATFAELAARLDARLYARIHARLDARFAARLACGSCRVYLRHSHPSTPNVDLMIRSIERHPGGYSGFRAPAQRAAPPQRVARRGINLWTRCFPFMMARSSTLWIVTRLLPSHQGASTR